MSPLNFEKPKRNASGSSDPGHRKSAISSLLGSPDTTALENRIIHSFLLLISLTGLVTTLFNILFDNPLPQTIITALCAAIGIGTYAYTRKTHRYQRLVVPLSVFFYCLLLVAFFVNNGTHGGAPYFLFIPIVPLIILLRQPFKARFFAVGLFTIFLVIAVEYLFPSVPIGYKNRLQQYVDIAVSLTVCLVIVTLMVDSVFKQYLSERRRKDDLLKQTIEDKEKIEKAFGEIKVLRGFLPICSNCKKIRDDNGYWKQIELYIREHSEAEFSHGICPHCARELYPELSPKTEETD
jgi:hypothetical protein